MGSALLDTTSATAAAAHPGATDAARMAHASSSGEALRQQAAERLAAHRSRRAGIKPTADPAQHAAASSNSRAAQIAAAVAERYAKSQSYKAFLAAEAERAVQQARAAAEVAAMQAEAMEAAHQSLLASFDTPALDADAPAERSAIASGSLRTPEPVAPEELSFWPEAELPRAPRHHAPRHAPRPNSPERTNASSEPTGVAPRFSPQNSASASDSVSSKPTGVAAGFSPRDNASSNTRGFSPGYLAASFAVRPEDNVHLPHLEPNALHENRFAYYRDDAPEEALALDEEIAFRHAPVFEEFRRPEPLPANLIEFPRQLVAPRKARPRLAEGPLRDEPAAEANEGQLRIFEVETSQISHAPAIEETAFPQWTNILLDAPQPAPAAEPEPAAPVTNSSLPGIASVARRTASAAVNGTIIGVALAAFAAAACITSGNVDTLRSFSMSTLLEAVRTPDGRSILAAGALVAVLLTFAYQALFFTFSTATPGMRCTRIALCTFDDNNPSRRALRRRILAILLSAVPFGLGFIWAALDEEKLSWHDRVSGTYQRQY